MARAPLAISLCFVSAALGLGVQREARAADTVASERDAFLGERRALMIGLGAWSVVSLAGGVTLVATDPLSRSQDPRRRAFRQSFGAITIAYALINGALAAGTLLSLERQRDLLPTVREIDFQRGRSATVFTFNVGLDMIHVLTGAMLWGQAPGATARGTGAAITTQSGVLLAFDTLGALTLRP